MQLSSTISKKLKARCFEKEAWADNKLACGIDEAGRGPLAGPVVISAAIIPANTTYKLLQDSKVLTEDERNKAFAWITTHCIYSTVIINHYQIDHQNIYQATKEGMLKAYVQLLEQHKVIEQLKYVLIDAMPLEIPAIHKHDHLEIRSFPFAESKSPSVAAASIVAKVIRDRLMKSLSKTFPAYNFAQHKGYGTPRHQQALLLNGPSLIHRRSFIKKFEPESQSRDKQQSLF